MAISAETISAILRLFGAIKRAEARHRGHRRDLHSTISENPVLDLSNSENIQIIEWNVCGTTARDSTHPGVWGLEHAARAEKTSNNGCNRNSIQFPFNEKGNFKSY
jgi:hypothetical protein